MAKLKVKFVCQECGFDSPKWLGRCPGCGAWNTMAEEACLKPSRGQGDKAPVKACSIMEVDTAALPRKTTGIGELDRVLGGGIVPGALILVGGDPGIGKSTLILQVAGQVSGQYGPVLYVSGEESAAQVKMRAERIARLDKKLFVLTETNLDEILLQAQAMKPVLVIIDSIQTVFSPEIPSAPGSVGQVRESTGKLLRFSKEFGIPVIVIGHVTKEGSIAGPRLLEHMVDVVLHFEGERSYSFRVLRAMKNRFGSTSETGIFSMGETGLAEVLNPSVVFLSERPEGVPGSVVTSCMEGVRPLLLEVQALVSTTCFGMPRRMAAGFDYNRMILLMAVLEKRLGVVLSNQDAYVNAVGGIKISEPAADLAVVLAIMSSFRNTAVDPRTVVVGEIGLTGEVRMVNRADARINEAAALGFRRCVVPARNLKDIKGLRREIEIIGVEDVTEAMEAVFSC